MKSRIATRSPRFNAMIDEIEHIAIKSRAPILLTGPTGAGKSFLARRVFELKKSRHQFDRKFVELNCATLHGDGAGSTLFGHIKGAFTGAASERPGLLRAICALRYGARRAGRETSGISQHPSPGWRHLPKRAGSPTQLSKTRSFD